MDKVKRVAVTGLGLFTAIGHDVQANWQNLMNGHSGLDHIRGFDIEGNTVRHGAEVDVSQLDERQKGKLRKADRTIRLAVEVSRQALEQAGVIDPQHEYPPQDIASLWGSGCGPCGALYDANVRFQQGGPKSMRPTTVPSIMINSISAAVSIHFQLQGTNQVIVSACTSSTNAIGEGWRMIRHGYADKVLCGGTEAYDPFYYGIWNNLGVFSDVEDPKKAVRPFDLNRRGTLLGEGAAAILLESFSSAESRGANILGEVLAYGESSDSSHLTAPSVDGQAQAIRQALSIAEIGTQDICYINTHGTGTTANDITESQSILKALGPEGSNIPVGASKSYFGHTLGASGAIESVVTLLALSNEVAPANLNLNDPDPECPLALIGDQPQSLSNGLAMKNSFGFGGGNGVLIFGRGQ